MSSRSFETRLRPRFDSCAPAHLKLGRVPASSPLPSRLCLDHSHCPVLVPATLAALPSTRAIPNRDVFHVAFPKRSIVSRLLPQRSTASSRLYRPCRSSHSLHSL